MSSYSATSASTSAGAAASTAETRSLTPHVLTWTPKMASASVLSPSVTATYRMLSPNRASRSDRVTAQPAAARVHVATCPTTRGSVTCPATVLHGTESLVK